MVPNALQPMSTRFVMIPADRLRRSGFSLVEILVVVMVMALIVAAAAPSVFNTITATRLTSAGQGVVGQLSLARQLAQSRNESVEVRFYQYEDPEIPGSKKACRAMSIMRVQPAATAAEAGGGGNILREPLTEVYYLPSGTVIGQAQVMSPLFFKLISQPDQEKLIRRAESARYLAIRFTPDGGTNLESASILNGYKPAQSYITLIEEKANDEAATEIPKNFFTVQIDPATGKASTYRP